MSRGGAWLLRPSLAEQLHRPAAELEPATGPEPPPSPAVYHQVTIETPVDWRQWYDFYQAVIKPLVESGAEVRVELKLEAEGEIDANLVDLSVKESVVQLDGRGRVVAG